MHVKHYNNDLSSWYEFWLLLPQSNNLGTVSIVSKWVNTDLIENHLINDGEKFCRRCLCSGKMWKPNVKNIFFISFPMLACRSAVMPCGTQVSYYRLHNHLRLFNKTVPSVEIFQTTINTCLSDNILSLWLVRKKKIQRNKNYITSRKMIILIKKPWQALILPMIDLYCVKMCK